MSTPPRTLTDYCKNAWEMERAIKSNVKPDERTLVWAISSRIEAVAKLALEAGASFEEWDCLHPDRTVLSYAGVYANPEVVQAVIAKGAHPGTNTLTWTIRGGNAKCVSLVIDANALPDDSTMDAAKASKNPEIIQILKNHNFWQS